MQPERQADILETSNVDLNDTILTRRLESLDPCRVLVVDDDDLVRARLSALLRMSQFDVQTAGSGEEALRIMNTTPCQILLTDWQMPDMDGLALCRNIRAEKRESYVYVVMLTVRDSKQDLLTGLAAGADDYVVKGAPIEEILARLEIARRITHVETSLRASNRENRRLAVTDPLTGANNLRYLMKYLPRELARSRRYAHPMAVLSCDIDGFKQINDRFGHEAGNELLRAFVARSESCLRQETDWLARVGGDEFMIVLPETSVHGANRVAQKLRHTYSQYPVSTHAGPVSFTASVGVTAVEAAHEIESVSRIEHLLRAADRGLYASKRLGGDRVSAASVLEDMAAAAKQNGAKNGAN
jgi:two-component system chemotaxis response regulator CheY